MLQSVRRAVWIAVFVWKLKCLNLWNVRSLQINLHKFTLIKSDDVLANMQAVHVVFLVSLSSHEFRSCSKAQKKFEMKVH